MWPSPGNKLLKQLIDIFIHEQFLFFTIQQLRHENLVNLLEVFRRKKRLFLVFEFVERTVLDDLEKRPEGLEEIDVKKISFQVLRGLDFCHNHNVSLLLF